VIARLNAEFNRALQSRGVIEKLAAQGMEAVGGTPQQFGAQIRADMELYDSVVKKAKLGPQ